jgi:hypothetical protein
MKWAPEIGPAPGDSDGQGQAAGDGHGQGPAGPPATWPGHGRRDGGAGDGQDQHEGAARLAVDRAGHFALKLVALQEHDRAPAGGPLI